MEVEEERERMRERGECPTEESEITIYQTAFITHVSARKLNFYLLY